MRKHILATTAVAVAGALSLSQASAAEMKAMKPSLKISGYVEQGIGFNENKGDIVHHTDAEIQFTAGVTLDNGLSVSGRIELEGDAHDTGIDEAFVTVTGSFGQIVMGGADGAMYEKTAGYLATWGANTGLINPDFNNGQFLASADYTPSLSGPGTIPRVSNDHRMIAFYTPRMSGVQVGVSYAQEGAGGTDGLETSLTYAGSFGEANIGIGLGYGMLNSASGEDHEVTMAGLRAGFGGVTFAVSYIGDINSQFGDGDDTDRFDVGVRYMMGDIGLSIGLMTVENGAGAELTTSKASISRKLGPGVAWSADLMIGDYTNADGKTGDALGVHTGIAISF